MTSETTPPAPHRALVVEHFVGREVEMAVLRTHLDAALVGHPALVLLAGEPGIGKTRTADELAAEARAQAVRVLWGRCWEDEGAPPFWPWIKVIQGLLRQSTEAATRGLLGADGSDIASLVPEVRRYLPNLSRPVEPATEQARNRVFESVANLLRRAAGMEPLLLVLDDLQGADPPSLQLLRSVVRHLRTSAPTRLLIVGTCREAGLDALRNAVEPELIDTVVPLRGLDGAAIGRFVNAFVGTRPAATLVTALRRSTNGNPLFLKEVLQLLGGAGADTGGLDIRIPHDVGSVLARRLGILSTDCRHALSVASVIGREFRVDVLGKVLRETEPSVETRLREAVDAGLLLPVPDDVGGYRFSHALICETLYQGLEPDEREQLHHSVGVAIEQQRNAAERLAELVHHFAQAGTTERATFYALKSAEHALQAMAYEEAARLCEIGLSALDRVPESQNLERCRLLLALASARKLSGEAATAQQTSLQAIELARQLHAAVELGRAVLGYLWVTHSSYADPAAGTLLEEALNALPATDSALRAELLGTLASQSLVTADPEQSRRGAVLGREALAMARRVGDPQTLSRTVRDWYHTAYSPDNLDERLATTTELIELGKKLPDAAITLEGLRLRMPGWLERGDIPAFDADVAAYATHAAALRQPQWLWRVPLHRCARRFLAGEFADAEGEAEIMLREGQRAEEPEATSLYYALLFSLRAVQGRLGEIPSFETAARQLLEQQPWNIAWRAGIANGLLEIGQRDAGVRMFEEIAAADFADLPRDTNFLVALGYLAAICSALGDRRRAARLYEILWPYAAHNLVQLTLIPINGPATRHLGLLARTMGRWDDAADHLEAAITFARQMQARPFVALSQYDLAALLVARNAPGDLVAARSLLETSIAASRDMAMGMRLAHAEELLQLCRRPGATRARPQSPSATQELRTVQPWLLKDETFWIVSYGGTVVRLQDAKGMHYLAYLLQHPGEEISPVDLMEQRSRIRGQGPETSTERSFDRERARSAVGKRIRAAIKRIRQAHPAFGRYLATRIRTGFVCKYDPLLFLLGFYCPTVG